VKTPEAQAIEMERMRCRELLAEWMMENNFSTGHGDTIEDLLLELTPQVKHLQARLM
jgi:hypothetical protein